MTTRTWTTPCVSGIPPQSPTNCILPIIGLQGVIVNTTPSTNQGPQVTDQGSCPRFVRGACPQSSYDQVCNGLACPPSYFGSTCTPTLGDFNCIQGACFQSFTVTKQCLQINGTLSCPQGTYLGSTQVNGTTSAVCQYNATQAPWVGSGLPTDFTTPMGHRLDITRYLSAFMNALYADPTGISIFHTNDYTTQQDLIKQLIYTNNPPTTYPNNQATQDFFTSAAAYPQFLISPGTGGIPQFRVIFHIYDTTPGSNPNLSQQDLTNYLQAFTLETGNVSPTTSGAEIPGIGCSFSTDYPPSDALTNPCYIIADLANQRVYNVDATVPQVNINTLRQRVPNGDFYIIGRNYGAAISRLSPNLLYLIQQSVGAQLVYDTLGAGGLCDRFVRDTNFFPLQCFKNTCEGPQGFIGTEQCKNIVEQFCPISQIYSTPYSGIEQNVTDFLFQSGVAECNCYDSPLAPFNIRGTGAPAALCFTTNCTGNQGFVDAFNLTDANCSQYCNTVCGWLNNPGDQGPVQRSVLDQERFNRLCNCTISPGRQTTQVWLWVLLGGLFLTIVLAALGYVVSRKIWVPIVIAVLFLAVTVFLTIDLRAQGACQNNEQVCRSNITRIRLPNSWCVYQTGCECDNFGAPCPQGGVCQNGFCVGS